MRFLIPAFLLLLAAAPAQAYVGPGLGLGVIAVIVGIALTVLIALLVVFWYPLKRSWRRISGGDKERGKTPDNADR